MQPVTVLSTPRGVYWGPNFNNSTSGGPHMKLANPTWQHEDECVTLLLFYINYQKYSTKTN